MPKAHGMTAVSRSIMEPEKDLTLSMATICLALASVLLLLLCLQELSAMRDGHRSENTQLRGTWIIPQQPEDPRMPTLPIYREWQSWWENMLPRVRPLDTPSDGSSSGSPPTTPMEYQDGTGD